MTDRSRPLHARRQRRRDRFNIAAGAQAEDGAAVVEQVEFDIASTAHELLVALGLAPGRREIPPHQFGIDRQERASDRLREGEAGLPVPRIKVVVEDAADAAHLLPVLEREIVFAPGFVFLMSRYAGVP